MKLSDYIIEFLSSKGIKHVFAVTGGAAAHLIDSADRHPRMTHICVQHEQAGAMSADAYSRATANLGAAIATSGPGATNLLTGICCAYYDSIPVMYITGQVSTKRSKAGTGVRQIGFQETDVVSMFRYVTNYAVHIKKASLIRYELEKAFYLAKHGRPGPVLIDVPDNIQREEVNPERLPGFQAPSVSTVDRQIDKKIIECLDLLKQATRPVVIFGWGVRLAHADADARKFIERLNLPMAPTWAMADILPSNHRMYIGTFGTHGTRSANFAVQNADLIISVGSRLDTKATGSPISSFARGAKKVMVDIDRHEITKFRKFGLKIDVQVCCDAGVFLKKINSRTAHTKLSGFSSWHRQIQTWKKTYPICLKEYRSEYRVNPYVFVKSLSKRCRSDECIVVDTGCSIAWMMQGFEFKRNQRLYHDWNNTAMGWALPASVGVSLARGGKRVVSVIGDGSLHMTAQELATVVRHGLPLKIFLINNKGYSMIRQTQDQWLSSRYVASSFEGGLAIPDFIKIAKAYGLSVCTLIKNSDIDRVISSVLETPGPVLCNVDIHHSHRVVPQVKFGRPNEDPEPLLPRKEFLSNMIVKPLDASLT